MKQSMSSRENRHRFFSSHPRILGETRTHSRLPSGSGQISCECTPNVFGEHDGSGGAPLGIISNSSCTLLSFLDWVFSNRLVMDYRFGRIRILRYCYGGYRLSDARHRVAILSPSEPQLRQYHLMHVGLLNGREIENWLEIEITATSILDWKREG
ncbi:hypothetical protein BS47DRAFT_579597 [Hydnum rufescens UP504]|uniref:Uncharacterized protein n=1 Tax=Hydnum rufescens UP504 TaxID=1448309 RepID=A0A9P6AFX0_9AGAM|nr:hypothetical protein BS47DRAFT_579597 [Hydnum rufescens UP504]